MALTGDPGWFRDVVEFYYTSFTGSSKSMGKRMNQKFYAGCFIVVAFMAFNAEARDTWRWMERGKWVYGDKYPPGTVNPERMVNGAPPPVEEPSVGLAAAKAAKLFPVTVYGVDCSGCKDAVKLLELRKIPFVQKDPSKPDVYAEFKLHSPDSMIPVIMIGDRALLGYEISALNGALDDAGYDKLRMPAK